MMKQNVIHLFVQINIILILDLFYIELVNILLDEPNSNPIVIKSCSQFNLFIKSALNFILTYIFGRNFSYKILLKSSVLTSELNTYMNKNHDK